MQIQDIRHESASYNLEFQIKEDIASNDKLQINEPVRFSLVGSYVLIHSAKRDDISMEVIPVNNQTKDVIERIVSINLPRLSAVISITKTSLTVCVKTFPEKKILDYTIQLNEEFYKKLKKQVQLKNIGNPKEELANNVFFNINNTVHCIVGIHTKAKEKQKFNNFLIVGKDYYLFSKKVIDENEKTYYIADYVTNKINKSDYKFFLVQGKMKFSEEAEFVREETLVVMEEVGADSYVKIWDRYGEIEHENIMYKVNKMGSIHYTNYETEPGGRIRFDIAAGSEEKLQLFKEEFSKGDMLTALPINPFSRELNSDEFNGFLKNNRNFLMNLVLAADIIPSERCIYFWSNDEIVPKLKVPEGYIFMSISGDIKRLQRRGDARRKIDNAQCPMPNLSAVLEGRSVTKGKSRNLKALSELVLNEIFSKNPPTLKQEQAIEIALNTPDIALIQGPPGTGKTTVITAILKRLNEESKSSEGIFGQNLVTAFQHDAVQNAIDRIEILGLPAIKFGKKSGSNDDEILEINGTIENWISEKCSSLYTMHSSLLDKKYISKFNDIYTDYMYSANSVEQTIKLLEDARKLLIANLSKELLDNLNRQIRDLKYMTQGNTDPVLKDLIRSIRRIPISENAYVDNGLVILREAVYKLKRLEDNRFENLIIKLDDIVRSSGKIDFTELRNIRKELIVSLIPKENIFTSKAKKEEITNLLINISEYLLEQVSNGKNGEEFVILEYIQALEENPLAVKNAILNYTAVNGATNQQVMRKEIADLKGGNIQYDNVLVDEAARSNPLDLFIPMSIAKDRIILVGDHRQLPHIVDEEIVRKLEGNLLSEGDVKSELQNKLKESMFEQLFKKLKKLEAADGINRTITLDKQYRMHPKLGNFVNDNFYKKYDESEAVESPRGAEEFTHNLPGIENKACIWYDIPISEGKELSGQSKSRRIEAKRIAEHIKEMLLSEDGKKMNFGIITFYKEQVFVITDELYKAGVFVKDEDNNYEVAPKFRFKQGSKLEKIKVGTVDAFQGMEFDLVYLSMVRSNTLPSKTEKERQRKYGFLMYENRLCVSMSRQKKALICVGDSTMLDSVDAEDAIAPLVEYYKMCKEEKQYGQII